MDHCGICDNEQERFQYVIKIGALKDQYPKSDIQLVSRYDSLETLKIAHEKALYDITSDKYLADLREICKKMLLLKLQVSMYAGDRDINVANTFTDKPYYHELTGKELHKHIWDIGDEIKFMHRRMSFILSSTTDDLNKFLMEQGCTTSAYRKIYPNK
jgi:hypothetical protein